MIRKLPATWDMEADVVCVGSGAGGLGAAITAHDHGASALVLERSDKVGGVTAFSMGEVWVPGHHLAAVLGIEDSIEAGVEYIRNLSMGFSDDAAVLNQALHAPAAIEYFEEKIGLKMCVVRNLPDYYYPYVEGSTQEGRCLEALPFPAQTLGEWQEKTRVSPHVPYSLTHEDIFDNGGMANMANWDYTVMGERLAKDERCAGPGLAAYFVKGALDRGIALHTDTSVEELVYEDGRVVGLRATQGGRDLFVKANRGVVLAVSSFERNPGLSKRVGSQLEPKSMVMPSIQGAHLRMAGEVGAQIARVPDVSMLSFHVPGEEQEEGVPLWRGALPFMGLPHTIVVNRKGERFANEAFYRSVYFALEEIDGMTQQYKHFPCWVITDSQARDKYPFGSVMPGEPMPAGLGVQADSLEELATLIGVDAPGLVATVERFNGYSEAGEDPEFRRGTFPWGALMCGDPAQLPNPNLGALSKPPYFAVELHRMAGGGITSAGILADEHCRAVGWDGSPIDGLYVAGNSAARLDNGALMQSGITNARGITHGYLAGRHAAGKPSDLLQTALKALFAK
jgi:3-oxosteroid 1-dehydrogenase